MKDKNERPTLVSKDSVEKNHKTTFDSWEENFRILTLKDQFESLKKLYLNPWNDCKRFRLKMGLCHLYFKWEVQTAKDVSDEPKRFYLK